jgi:hypothetical protein
MISYRDVSIREWALSVWILRLASRKIEKYTVWHGMKRMHMYRLYRFLSINLRSSLMKQKQNNKDKNALKPGIHIIVRG